MRKAINEKIGARGLPSLVTARHLLCAVLNQELIRNMWAHFDLSNAV